MGSIGGSNFRPLEDSGISILFIFPFFMWDLSWWFSGFHVDRIYHSSSSAVSVLDISLRSRDHPVTLLPWIRGNIWRLRSWIYQKRPQQNSWARYQQNCGGTLWNLSGGGKGSPKTWWFVDVFLLLQGRYFQVPAVGVLGRVHNFNWLRVESLDMFFSMFELVFTPFPPSVGWWTFRVDLKFKNKIPELI